MESQTILNLLIASAPVVLGVCIANVIKALTERLLRELRSLWIMRNRDS